MVNFNLKGSSLRRLEGSLGSLSLRVWEPAGEPAGTALIVPGFAMHGEPYAPLATALAGRGILTGALDVPGSGQTGGTLTLRAARWAVLTATRYMERESGTGAALIGDSAGAAYILSLGRRANRARRLALLAPGLLIRPERVLGPTAARDVWEILRGRGMPTLLSRLEKVSTNPAFIAARRSDPLMVEAVGPSYLIAVVEGVVAGFLNAARVSVPTRIWHGTGDRILSPLGSRLIARRLPAPGGGDPLTIVPGGEHGLIWDPVAGDEVIEDVAGWISSGDDPSVAHHPGDLPGPAE